MGRRLYHRHHQRAAVAVLQHRARRLRDLGPGAPLQRGGRAERERSCRQSLSAGGLSHRRVPERHPLRHDRGRAGRARLDRLRQFRVQGAQLAGRGADDGRALPPHRAVGRAELHPPLSRRGRPARRRLLRRAARPDLGRAGAGDVAGGAARHARPPGRAGRRHPRPLRLHRDAGRAGAMRGRRRAAEPRARSLLSRGGRARRPDAGSADGESGALAITHLHRRGTVLLRYLVGDIVTLSRTPCPLCGRAGERVVATPRRTGNLVKCRGMLVNTDVIVDTLSAMAGHRRIPDRVRGCGRAGRDGAAGDPHRARGRCRAARARWNGACARRYRCVPEVEFVARGALYDHERSIKARRVVDLRTNTE